MKTILTKLVETLEKAEKDEALRPIENEAEKKVSIVFLKQGEETQKKLEKYQDKGPPKPDDFTTDLEAVFAAVAMKSTLIEILNKAFEKGGKLQFSDLVDKQTNLGIGFNVNNPRATQWIQNRAAEMVTNINDTTKKRIRQILSDAAEKGWDYKQTAKMIKSEFDGFAGKLGQKHIRNRAELVALTETSEAFAQSAREAAKQVQEVGVPMEKYWSNTGDGRVSDKCRTNTRAGWIDMDSLFPSGHMTEPRFPGCRCKVLYRRKENE